MRDYIIELSQEESYESRDYILERLTRFESRIKAALSSLPGSIFDKRLLSAIDKEKVAKFAYKFFIESIKSQNDIENSAVNQQVEIFFKRTFKKFKKQGDAPLPMWFHATEKIKATQTYGGVRFGKEKMPFEGIINSQQIEMSDEGTYGKGAYISSNDEKTYGPFLFAVDDWAVNGQGARIAVFDNRFSAQGNIFDSLYVAVQGKIQISKLNLAYVAAEDTQFEYAREIIEKSNCKMLLISRKASDYIHTVFDQVYKSGHVPLRVLPSRWFPVDEYTFVHPAFQEKRKIRS